MPDNAAKSPTPDIKPRLLELAEERFGDELTDADRHLFQSVAQGEWAVYGDGELPPEEQEPDSERTISADRIRWLCTDANALAQVLPYAGIQVQGARIEGRLLLNFVSLDFPLGMQSCSIPDGIYMRSARLRTLLLSGSRIGGLQADSLRVDGMLLMRAGFCCEGEVNLRGAHISQVLDCTSGEFKNDCCTAIDLDIAQVRGSIFFRDRFRAEGGVRLVGARIGGVLECGGGAFIAPEACAIRADSVEVTGSVYFRFGCRVKGAIDFTAANIAGGFQFRQLKEPRECQSLRLTTARVGILYDDEKSWPDILELDGFIYDRIYETSPLDAETRVNNWIRRNDHGRYLPQPYEQLAKVLREMGHTEEAKKVLIAKKEDPARLSGMTKAQRFGHSVFGATLAYGHHPWRSARYMLCFFLLGTTFFTLAAWTGGLEQVNPDYRPRFNSIVYSLDAFVPLIDFQQAKYFLPLNWYGWLYYWIHTAAGWTLCTLLVVDLTRLVRK